MAKYITIDPGLNGTGWATWDRKWNLLNNGVIVFSRTMDIELRMLAISREVKEIVKFNKIQKLFIEKPMMFGGNTGMMVARRGDLVKLSILVGYIEGYAGCKTKEVDVIKWKGQLPKDVVIRRIHKLLPDVKAKSHDYDAIGIGLYCAGRF